jgi:hypothetical protein
MWVLGEAGAIETCEGVVFRVSSLGTYVSGVVGLAGRALARCLGIAEASLSLSLSLTLGAASRN